MVVVSWTYRDGERNAQQQSDAPLQEYAALYDAAQKAIAAVAERLIRQANELKRLADRFDVTLRAPQAPTAGLAQWPYGSNWSAVLVGTKRFYVVCQPGLERARAENIAKEAVKVAATAAELWRVVQTLDRAYRWCRARTEGVRRHARNLLRAHRSAAEKLRALAALEEVAEL